MSQQGFLEKAAQVQQLRQSFTSCLEQKRLQRDELFRDLLGQERAMLINIRNRIRSNQFKRAYENGQFRTDIEIMLRDLKEYRLEKGKALGALRRIAHKLDEILMHQAEEENNIINGIQEQFDGQQWEVLRKHFEDERFLRSLWVIGETGAK